MTLTRSLVLFVAIAVSVVELRSAPIHHSASQAAAAPRITGRVVLGDTAPVRRAHIVATGPATLTTDSDPDGAFHLNGVPAGQYRVVAAKPGFLQAGPVVVDVAAGATAEVPIKVVMARAGAVSVRVIDPSGIAIADTAVFLSGGGTVLVRDTDDRGVFRFHTLRDGAYSVWVAGEEKSSARPVSVVGGRTEELQIVVAWNAPDSSPSGTPPPEPRDEPLAPGTHAIRGRITSAETGAPIPQATVNIGCEGPQNNRQNDAQTQTSPSGRFIFRDVPVGRCSLHVSGLAKYVALFYGQKGPLDQPTQVTIRADQAVVEANLELPEPKSLSGRMVDEFGDPAPDVTVVAFVSRVGAGKLRFLPFATGGGPVPGVVSNDLGEFRLRNVPPATEFFVMALSGPFASVLGGPSGPQSRGYGFAPTFFPGTAVPADAQPVQIGARGEPSPVRFSLAPAEMGTVTGLVTDRSGSPQKAASIMLLQLHGGDVRMLVPARATTDANGFFSIENVPAGTYVAQAFARDGFGSSGTIISSRDSTTANLIVTPPATVRGRLTFDGVADPGALLKTVRIRTTQVDFVRGPAGGVVPPSTINDDGTFEVQGLVGFNVLTFDIPSPWTMANTSVAGVDMTDRPFDSSAGDVDGVQVRFTQQASTAKFQVSDAAGRRLATGFVLVVPQDSAKWGFPSRGVRGLVADANGDFTATALPPGVYRAVPFERAPRPDWMSPDYLETVRGLGEGFTIGPGETVTVRLVFRK